MRGERNYHIFYMVCKSDASIRDPVNIQEWKKYNICSQTGTVAEVNSWNDNAEFKDAHAAFIKLGFSEQQRRELYTLVSICLSLGNVQFEDPDVGEGCLITTPEVLELTAEMMQIAPEDLGQAITSKTMGGGVIEVFIKPLEARQAATARSSMIAYMYCLMFDWCARHTSSSSHLHYSLTHSLTSHPTPPPSASTQVRRRRQRLHRRHLLRLRGRCLGHLRLRELRPQLVPPALHQLYKRVASQPLHRARLQARAGTRPQPKPQPSSHSPAKQRRSRSRSPIHPHLSPPLRSPLTSHLSPPLMNCAGDLHP